MFYMKTEKFLVPVQVIEMLSKGKNQLMALKERNRGRERRRERGTGINELLSGPAVNLKVGEGHFLYFHASICLSGK